MQPSAPSWVSDGTPPRMGVNFPLDDFERLITADPDVLGMVYNGSLGRGKADLYSDIDVRLWLRDAVIEKPGILEHYMRMLGELHFVFAEGLEGNGYNGPDWQVTDLGIMAKHEFVPEPYFHGARVMKDTDGWLTSIVAASQPSDPHVTPEMARAVVEETIHILGFITMHNMRGSFYHAMCNLCEQAGNLYGLLARLRGYEGFDVRYVEQFLQPHEVALLYSAWPAAPQRDEIRRAVQSLWDWTRYVWNEAEQTLGASLDISLDTEAFLLAALARPYIWERV